MDVFGELRKGLGNLSRAQRSEIYRDLRAQLEISESEPLIPLPLEELRAWGSRFAEVLIPKLEKCAATRMTAQRELLEAGFAEYAKTATDDFLDSQLLVGPMMRDAGLSGLYLDSFLSWVALQHAGRAAREVLSPASAAIVEARYPAVMLLRHALTHEGFLGTSQVDAPVKD